VRLGARRREAELMDRPDAPRAELDQSLADLRVVNRWLGGTRAVLRLVRPLVAAIEERPIRILDVATGSADVPMALARWAARERTDLRLVASDFHLATLSAARSHTAGVPRIELTAADALRLPFTDDAFHIALCCTALHHFDDADAVTAIRELARVASRAVVVLDLRSSLSALLGARLLAATLWRRHPTTRHDGPASVRAAFTSDELRNMAEVAGLHGAAVTTHSFMRHSLVWRADGALA
jgi:ubiquinone/menaquinone biosynthesis C-methylase UbiE